MNRINNPIALMGATDEEVKQQLDETDNARNRMVAGITYSIAIVKGFECCSDTKRLSRHRNSVLGQPFFIKQVSVRAGPEDC